ncbi:MAG: HupE/UreJ family protein [Tumebacillaceae bacterium]
MSIRSLIARIVPIFLLLTLLFVPAASAHQDSLASSKLTFENKKMRVMLLIDQKSILEINGYDIEKITTLSEDQLSADIKDKSMDYISKGFHVKNNGQEMSLELENISIPDFSNVQFDLIFSSDQLIDKVDIDYDLWFENSDGKHKNVATIENGKHTDEFVFNNTSRHLSMEAGVELPFWSAIGQFIVLGVEHILTGYDHLMFLLALIILGGSFTNILKIVTSFTVAHSITLILASLELVSLPSRLVESVIAASILYVAIENQFVKSTAHRWMITFAFGLIHGFGFAGALAETQIPKNHFISSLLTFNVGVELGQLLVVIILLPLILYMKRFSWNNFAVRGVSGIVGLFGLLWLIQRVFELEILPF